MNYCGLFYDSKSRMKYVVLMASHLGCRNRYTTIKWALESLYNQSKKPNLVYVSYSYNIEIGPPNTFEWSQILGDIEHKFFCYRVQVPQFVHYKRLFRYFNDENTVVMFLDDDDLYHQDKIKIISETFDNSIDVEAVCHTLQFFQKRYYDSFLIEPHMVPKRTFNMDYIKYEYCSFCIKSHCLTKIMNKINEMPKNYIIQSIKVLDLMFKNTIMDICNVKELNVPLMYIRKDLICETNWSNLPKNNNVFNTDTFQLI